MAKGLGDRLVRTGRTNTVEYHLHSMRLAAIREWMGGIKAVDSNLLNRAVTKLMTDHGMAEEQIVKAYKEKYAA